MILHKCSPDHTKCSFQHQGFQACLSDKQSIPFQPGCLDIMENCQLSEFSELIFILFLFSASLPSLSSAFHVEFSLIQIGTHSLSPHVGI